MFQLKLVVLAVVSVVSLFVNTVSAQTQVYFNDFESAVGAEWSNRTRSTTPIGGRNFLGRFGSQAVILTLKDLPQHTSITVSLDLFIIYTMDGNSPGHPEWGPDTWKLSVDGNTLIQTTFSNIDGHFTPNLILDQSYPDTWLDGHFPPLTGAIEIDTLGYTYYDDACSCFMPMNSVYFINHTFSHSVNALNIDFSAILIEEGIPRTWIDNESWGLDNVKVELIAENQPPQITHTPITSAIQNQNIKVDFEAKDLDGNLLSVELFYRITGAVDYQNIGMSPAQNQTQFTLEIPANAVTLAGVDYYIEAKDVEGAITTTPVYHIKVVDKWPVIIIPGVMGTHLNRINALGVEDRVWIDRTQACGTSPSDSFLDALQLDEDGHNSPGETILLGSILKSGFGINFYGNLIQYLIDHGSYRENVDLFDCPYDWRLDNTLSVLELSSKINTALNNTGTEKVNIIAHSMGGLVTRSYIHRFGEDKINKIIYLGTPHQGTAKSFNALAFDEGLHDLGLKFDCLTTSTLSNLAVTLPSIYQLLPRATFIYDWDEKHDIALSEAYKTISQGGFLRSDRWVALADTFYFNISNPITLPQYLIVGTGCATINRIMVRMEKNRTGGDHRCWFGRYGNGDDTVPQESAIAALGSDVTVFYADRVPHANLPNNENVDGLILDILQDNLSNPLPSGIARNPFNLPPEGLVVFNTCSPITLRITDETGNINVEHQDGSIGENIPFSTFLNFEDSQGGVLVRNQIYELHFDAVETGECSLSLEYLSMDGDIIGLAEYINFPVSKGSSGIMVLEPDSTTPEILLDIKGDGNKIFNLLPNTEIPKDLKNLFAQRGDINHDNMVDISDAVNILGYLFLGAEAKCPEAGKVNSDDGMDVSDAVYLLGYLFLGTAEKPNGLIFCQ